jgi:scyllo-inositol 2-dehydrogenase (NADP+)
MKSPIPVAVVGLGRAGWLIHIAQLQKRKDFKIVDVVDPNPDRLMQVCSDLGCTGYSSLDELLKKTHAKLVVIATPSHLHESDALKIFRSGRHCVVEKPMALSSKSSSRMVSAAKKAKLKLFVHQNHRFGDEFRLIRRCVDDGTLGDVFQINAFWTKSTEARRNDWQTVRSQGGGMLSNTGSHLIDLVVDLLDAPVTSLLSDLRHVKDAGDAEDHVRIVIKASNGRAADITLTTACPLPAPKWLIIGSKAVLHIEKKTATTITRIQSKKNPVTLTIGGQKNTVSFYDNVSDVLLNRGRMVVTPESVQECIRVQEWARRGTDFPLIQTKSK